MTSAPHHRPLDPRDRHLDPQDVPRDSHELPLDARDRSPDPQERPLDSSRSRWHMANTQLGARGITDPRVICAFLTVPREAFVPPALAAEAYADRPLPIGYGQTISQPYVVGLMAQALALRVTDRVLEIGTGSGYGAAILGELCAHVTTVERVEALAIEAADRLRRLGYAHVDVQRGDGTLGDVARQSYDAILVAAGGPSVPSALLEKLTIGGRLVIPVGPRQGQRLVRVTRTAAAEHRTDDLGSVMVVPLMGAEGWSDASPATDAPA